ncbi:hypothetical protein P7C73_g3149, partial [Tremellales sp. Uapishka_1]
MENRSPSPRRESTGALRRTARACAQCRVRKQRCDGASIPCQRCVRVGKECSFLKDGLPSADKDDEDPRWAVGQAKIQHLQDEVEIVKRRITELEGALCSRNEDFLPSTRAVHSLVNEFPLVPALPQSVAFINGSFSHAPIQTLRQLAGPVTVLRSPEATMNSMTGVKTKGLPDPVAQGILSVQEAQRLFDILLLQPSASDFTLDTIQALLLSIQWPALELDRGEQGSMPKSRFNDAYAWLMIGVAIRFSKYIGLEKCTESNLANPEDLSRIRIWLNLISIDRHLTMTAGLPASLEAPPSHVVRAFGSHPAAQSGDIKLAGLSELIAIVQRASVACGDVSLRKLDAISLKMAIAELDDWERRWALILGAGASPAFKQQMPFTAVRWYRLALNAIPIGAALGEQPRDPAAPTPPALAAGVDAAFHLIWQYSSEAVSERPERNMSDDSSRFTMNFTALSSFMFAVDSYWITHAYAAIFLVLVYDRGCIDSNLTIYPQIRITPPQPVPENSLLHRIIRFALAIFDGVCQGAAHHPAMQYRSIVANALHTLGQYQAQVENAAETGIDDMLNALMDPGQDWAFLRDLGFTM